MERLLYFTAKLKKRLFILDWKKMIYTYMPTVSGAFNEQPGAHVARIVPDKDAQYIVLLRRWKSFLTVPLLVQ